MVHMPLQNCTHPVLLRGRYMRGKSCFRGVELPCQKHLSHIGSRAGISQAARVAILTHDLSSNRCCCLSVTCSLRKTSSFPPCRHVGICGGWSRRRGRAVKCFLQGWPRRLLWYQFSLVMWPRCVFSRAPNTVCSKCNRYSARIGDLRKRQCGLGAASCTNANSVAMCACIYNREPRR